MTAIELESLSPKYKLKASDDKTEFIIDDKVLKQSVVLREMMEYQESIDSEHVIPLAQISAKALANVIKFCEHYVDEDPYIPPTGPTACLSKPSPSDWDQQFLSGFSGTELCDIMCAANFLNIPRLIDAACFRVANMVEGYTVPQIRRILHIPNDWTSAEENRLRNQHPWQIGH